MERKLAELVVANLERRNGSRILISEAMSMKRIPTDGIDVYAIQKGDVTFLAWVSNGKLVSTKTVAW